MFLECKWPVEQDFRSLQINILLMSFWSKRLTSDLVLTLQIFQTISFTGMILSSLIIGVDTPTLVVLICAYAREWANHLAAVDSFKHRTERKYGENIFMKWSSDPNHVVSGDAAVESWYSEIKDHTFGQEPRSLKSGHFTQVIWKDSKRMGVAWAKSKTGKILVVANYEPAGNFVGRFTENVPPPKK
ncbi:golgi-associated plant pathogenesis-related protein 1 [Caerostris extrusa]|uniref:Golgi-associated plant pathogenesis-related protein 1 n=1 Tax=Caerostris extrusa TaxID=172846 RepID=A0AAV4MUH6_CAEEX|nr:golgi-associated plant pathogenesis-related protein 1 [Caerostris extrusa]